MIRVGPEQVKRIAEGGGLAILNVTVAPRMIETRREWDAQDTSEVCWLDAVATGDETAVDPEQIPELAGSWEKLDETAKQFIKRLIGNSRASHETVNALAALAERVQEQVATVATRRAKTG